MERFWIFLELQIKRMFKAFPAVLLQTLFLSAGIVFLLYGLIQADAQDSDNQRIRLGIVGDTRDEYLGFGITALENLDSSRYTLELISFDKEEQAKEALGADQIRAYIVFPENFVDSIVRGENTPMTFCFKGGQVGIGAALVQELADSVSEVLVHSQAGIYTMQKFYISQNRPDSRSDEAELNIRYFDLILGRSRLFDLQLSGMGDGLSYEAYYICALLLFFLLVWGINGCHLLVHTELSVQRMLQGRGFGSGAQVLGEYLAWLLLFLVNYMLVGAGLTAILGYTKVSVEPFPTIGSMAIFLVRCLPVIICLSALQYFLYSLTESLTGGLLGQFLMAVGLGFLTGCFYPASFFPETLRRISGILPTGQCLSYMELAIRQKGSAGKTAVLLVWAVFFMLLSLLSRQRKMKG